MADRYRVEISDSAEIEADEIFLWIQRRNPDYAIRWYRCPAVSSAEHRSREVRMSISPVEGSRLDIRERKDVREVRTGFECGITIDGMDNFREGDLIEFTVKERVS